MSIRASCWSLTINNPVDSDEYSISEARQKGWKVEGQKEKGEGGTVHYQLLLRTPQVRFSAVKKVFPRAHIEVARNITALMNYVKKEDTRLAPLQIDQAKYPTTLQIYQWFSFYYYEAKKLYPKASNLEIFDLMCEQKIRQGYYLGAEVMNPQVRAFYKKFGDAIAHREKNKIGSLDRQTDRLDEIFSQPQFINNESETTEDEASEDEGSEEGGEED